MNVLFINTRYPPEGRAGPAFSVQYLAEAHASQGGRAAVLCRTDRPGLIREHLRGVDVIRLGTNLDHRQVSGILDQVLDHRRPQIVHTNLLTQLPVGALGPLVARRGIRLVHTIREFSLLCPRELTRDGQTCATQCPDCRDATLSHRAFAEQVVAAVGISRFMLALHQRMGLFTDTPVTRVIHNSYQPPTPVPAPLPTGGTLRLGYLGRLDPMKGIDLLLDALCGPLAGYDWSLLVGGRGSVAGSSAPGYESDLMQRFPDTRIRFCGFVAPHELLAQIDLLVVPSRWAEPLGRVPLEAYAHGVPVVASRRGGLPEIVDEGRTGLLFDPDEPGALATLLGGLMADPARVDRMKGPSLEKWRRDFTPGAILGQYRTLYEQLLDVAAPRRTATTR